MRCDQDNLELTTRWFTCQFYGKNRYWIHHARRWCVEKFGESTKFGPWIMHVTPSKMTYDSARVVVFFKSREDMVWFDLTWG
jgi:hypothetical protein